MYGKPTAALLCAFAALASAGPAVAQVRQTSRFAFDTDRPGAPAAVTLEIDYSNPSDPDAKPYAVQTVVETLAAGARIDTAVPERCGASDAELMARGAAACPEGSRVGIGELDLDSGVPGPGRIVSNRVTEFNNTDQLILLLEQPNGTRAVSRSPISDGGRTLRSDSPPLPGGPPDGYTAVKRVRVKLDRITATRDGVTRAYVTTPAECPASGAWLNTVSFSYRDGVKQTVPTQSACRAPAAPAARRVVIGTVPRACVKRSFVARIRVEGLGRLRMVRTSLDSRTIAVAARERFRVRVRPASRGRRHKLRVVARDAAGRRAVGRASFRSCAS